MGVLAEPVPESISVHLADLLPAGQGLLVTRVVPDSPASAAGLRANDIIVRYAETTLSSFAQMTELARGDAAGENIVLDIIRGGQTLDLEVTLGAAPLEAQPESAQPETVLPDLGPLPNQGLDFGQLLGPGQTLTIPPENVDMSAVGGQLLQKVQSLITNYRLVGVDYETLPGGQYRGVVKLADASGRILELPASGTETEVKLQLLRQLFELP